MYNLGEQFKVGKNSIANPKSIIKGDKYRISILTSRLIRFEYSESGFFEDRATENILNRFFEVPKYEVMEDASMITITSDVFKIFYMKNVFKFMFAVLAILLSLSSCRMYKRKAFAWGVGELKKQLPKEVAGKDFVVFDINVNVDTVEMSYKMSEKMWADFKQWEEIQNPDIIKAKLLSTASNDAIGIFVDDGMGLKYLIYSSETNKKLIEVCVSPDKLKEIYTKK